MYKNYIYRRKKNGTHLLTSTYDYLVKGKENINPTQKE